MPAPHSRLDAVPGIASCLAITVAALVLAGWTLDIDPLKRVLPGLVSMNPMTAVAFALAGTSLWLQRATDDATASVTRRRGFARLAAAVVVAIGLLRLAAVALGWDAGVDQWLFTDHLADDNPALPNRMAPNTALNFVMLGLALLTLDVTTRRGRRPAEYLASVVFLIALLALAGYAYRVEAFAGVANFIPMALHTAAVFLLLAVGTFVARPAAGMMAVVASPSLGGIMARRLLPGMVLALLALGWLRLEGERLGYYGASLGVALYTITNIAVFGVLIWWSARSLHRADVEQGRLAIQQRDSEAQVRLLLDSTAEAIYGIDADGRCTFMNQACVRMLGYAGGTELLGQDMHALIHHARPDGSPYPVEECRIYRALRADMPVHVDDEVFWRADGTSFAAEYWGHPMRRDGRLVGAVITFLDISARKEAEERLRRSEEQTDRFFTLSLDMLCIADADGYFRRLSPAFTKTLGWSTEEMLARPFLDFVHPEDHAATLAEVERQLTAGDPVLQFENRYRHKDGSWRLLSWLSVPHDGLMYATARDITEHRQAEARIHALNTELLVNAEQLKQINQELEAFSYTVSHDLRAPLRHIDGYARMLVEDAGEVLDGDPRRYLDAIGDSARHMGMLIDDLLAFSRLGRKPVERVAVDMDVLARRALEEARSGKTRTAQVSLGPLPPVHADPVLLRQVWVNLLSNALKYSATRGNDARIEVSGQSDGRVVRYQVRDNGVGFDMRYADKLFSVFQRLHSQDEFEGTGVGLAIVQRIVTRHGGRVWAEAEPGRGATFTIELPIVDVKSMEAA